METFNGLSPDEASEFAGQWLPAWTGNDPDSLVAFYAPDALYVDPAVPDGIVGHAQLRAYFATLLVRNPDWVWTHRGSMPLKDGFVNLWHASIPVATSTIEVDGLCTVQLRDGLIYRNEVYFDRSELIAALR